MNISYCRSDLGWTQTLIEAVIEVNASYKYEWMCDSQRFSQVNLHNMSSDCPLNSISFPF